MSNLKITDKIVENALTWMETPWRHQGRGKRGIDCAGLIIRVGNDLGLIKFDISHYPRHTNRDEFINHFKKVMVKQKLTERQTGDVLLFRDGIYACHCGILHFIKGLPYIIHSYVNHGKVVDEHLTEEFRSKMTHCFRFNRVGAS